MVNGNEKGGRTWIRRKNKKGEIGGKGKGVAGKDKGD